VTGDSSSPRRRSDVVGFKRSRPILSAGLIERFDNRILIALPPQPPRPSRLWRFPRGRVADSESPEEAMRRIAQDDLEIAVEIVIGQPPFLAELDGEEVELRFFICGSDATEASRGPYEEIRWIERGHLYEYEFDTITQPVVEWFLDTDGGR